MTPLAEKDKKVQIEHYLSTQTLLRTISNYKSIYTTIFEIVFMPLFKVLNNSLFGKDAFDRPLIHKTLNEVISKAKSMNRDAFLNNQRLHWDVSSDWPQNWESDRIRAKSNRSLKK